ENFRTFVREHPDDREIVSARQEFAIALIRAGDVSGAIEQLRGVTAALPDYAGGHIALGDALLERRDAPAAIAEYRRAVALQPDTVVALANLGNILAASQPEEAIGVLRKALSLEPRALPPRKQLARLLLTSGQINEMLGQTRELVARAPDDPESH